MNPKENQWRVVAGILGGLLVAVLVASAYQTYVVGELRSTVEQQRREASRMTTFTTSWCDVNGNQQTVSTTCAEAETIEQCVARHADAVAAAQAQFPPK